MFMEKDFCLYRKGIFFLFSFLMIFIAISIASFHPSDYLNVSSQNVDGVRNWFGVPGNFIASKLFLLFGKGAYCLILLLVLFIVSLFSSYLSQRRNKLIIGALFVTFTVSYLISFVSSDQSFSGGGLIAGITLSILKKGFGLFGQIFFLLLITYLSFYFIINFHQKHFTDWFKHNINRLTDVGKTLKQPVDDSPVKPPLFQKINKEQSVKHNNDTKNSNHNSDTNSSDNHISKDTSEEEIIIIQQFDLITHEAPEEKVIEKTFKMISMDVSNPETLADKEIKINIISNELKDTLPHESILGNFESTEDIEEYIIPEKDSIPNEISNPIPQKEIEEITIINIKEELIQPVNPQRISQPHLNNSDITKGFSVLHTSNQQFEEEINDEKDIIHKLEKTLAEFGIEARVINIAKGPVITCYEVQPSPGIKLSRIVGLQDNLALSLEASKIRIVAPIPGKAAVGIEIPNRIRAKVTLGDLFTSLDYKNHHCILPIALGQGISGITHIVDLMTLPHLLIAGATGAGKSVFVNTLICSLISSTTPSNTRFIMIDPKRVELKMYDEIPYLLCPVITEPKQAVYALKWAVNMMEERYKLLEKYSCRDIRSFNNKIEKMRQKDYVTDPPLEYIVIIIDEFADLMMVCGKEAEAFVSRLAAMSRAVGIHLVVATQRPSVDVITGLIKANFPARIAFQVSSKTESRIILDHNGAEKLLGKGDFLFSAPGVGNMIRIQGAYLSEDEVHDITSYLKSLAPPEYIEELQVILEGDSENTDLSSEDEPLFREAVEIILSDRKASASYLQRKMRIGYNRAARIIELLEQEGIVSPANGSKPREVLVESYQK